MDPLDVFSHAFADWLLWLFRNEEGSDSIHGRLRYRASRRPSGDNPHLGCRASSPR